MTSAQTFSAVTHHAPPATEVFRAFAFVDLTGFTDFTDEHGGSAALGELLKLRAALRSAAAAHGVRIDKFMGDGALVVGVEFAPVVEVLMTAYRIATNMDLRLPLRGALGAGAVLLVEGDDYVGRALNMTARLCDLAAPNQVLLPSALTRHLPGGVVSYPAGELELRGITVPIMVDGIDLIAA
jgi:class 3 adenylate cyclase